jgi:hypothetical protein
LPSLFDAQWAQGALVRHGLPYSVTTLQGGELTLLSETHDLWILAEQDCDLSRIETTDDARFVELRAVSRYAPRERPMGGLAGKKFRLNDELLVSADGARATLAACALHFLEPHRDRTAVNSDRRRKFKTWLGMRYDRPAVPDRFIDASKALFKRLSRDKTAYASVRDVLVRFDPGVPPVVHLWAVTVDANPATIERTGRWLRAVATELSDADLTHQFAKIGLVEVQPARNTSLEILESYYSLDLEKLCLREGQPDHWDVEE